MFNIEFKIELTLYFIAETTCYVVFILSLSLINNSHLLQLLCTKIRIVNSKRFNLNKFGNK